MEGCTCQDCNPQLHEPCYRCKELEDEVERLKNLVPIGSVEQKKWMDLCDRASKNETRSRKRAERAEAEVERLRAFERQDHEIRSAHGWKRDGRELPELVRELVRERDEAPALIPEDIMLRNEEMGARIEAALAHIQMRADFGDELDPDDLVKILTGGRE